MLLKCSLVIACLLVAATLATASSASVDLSLYTVRAAPLDHAPPGSYEPQYAGENELQQIKQERAQQLEQESQQSPSNNQPSNSQSVQVEEKEDHNSNGNGNGNGNTVVVEQRDSNKSPALIEFPLTPAEAMYGPYLQQMQQAQQLQMQQLQQKASASPRFMQLRGPGGGSAGAPPGSFSSYSMVMEPNGMGFGNSPLNSMGTFRPLVNLHSDGTPYPLDMRKYDYFRPATGSTS